jgi:hypothetical protein
MGEPTKGAWNRPELTVLVRGAPEEAVLTGCKVFEMSGSNNIVDGWCYALKTGDNCNVSCNTLSGS